MQLPLQYLASRSYPFLDPESFEEGVACDTLFRFGENEFLLHMVGAQDDDRLVWLDSRAALTWLNATPEEFGLEWQ
jgi:hypothetical protein